MNLFNINKEYYLIKYLIILGWLSCLISVGFNPEFFNQLTQNNLLNFEKFNYRTLIFFLRGIGNLIFFPILLFIFFKLINLNLIILKSEFFFLAISILFLIQVIGLLVTENPNTNIYYLISSLNIIIMCLIIKNYFFKNELILIFNITFFTLIGIFVVYGTLYINTYFLEQQNFDLYRVWGNIKSDFSLGDIPRPSGLSRVALIVLIISSLLYKTENKFYRLTLILIPICSFFIFSLGSRLILFIYIFYIIFYFFLKKLKKIKDIFFNVSIFFLIPLVLILLINNSFGGLNYETKIDIKSEASNNKFFFRKYPQFRKNELNKFSSGRLDDWKSILIKNKKIIYGNGVMGDRYLINQSASNLIFYTYSSSGILGLIIIIYIYLKAFIFSIPSLIKKNNYYFKDYRLISSIGLIVLLLRSILETSFGVFGIDLFLFCLFVTIITFKNKK